MPDKDETTLSAATEARKATAETAPLVFIFIITLAVLLMALPVIGNEEILQDSSATTLIPIQLVVSSHFGILSPSDYWMARIYGNGPAITLGARVMAQNSYGVELAVVYSFDEAKNLNFQSRIDKALCSKLSLQISGTHSFNSLSAGLGFGYYHFEEDIVGPSWVGTPGSALGVQSFLEWSFINIKSTSIVARTSYSSAIMEWAGSHEKIDLGGMTLGIGMNHTFVLGQIVKFAQRQ